MTLGLLRSTESESCTPQGRNTSAMRLTCGDETVFENAGSGIDIVDGASIDADGSEQAGVFAGASQVAADVAVGEKMEWPP